MLHAYLEELSPLIAGSDWIREQDFPLPLYTQAALAKLAMDLAWNCAMKTVDPCPRGIGLTEGDIPALLALARARF